MSKKRPPPPSSAPGRRDWDAPRRFRINMYIGDDQGLHQSTNPFQYENVHVLLFCWEEDDSGCWGEMSALADVFGRGFGYNVNRCRIPNCNPYQWVEQKLTDFKYLTRSLNDLAIVYFHGHANFDDRVRLRACPRE